MRWPIAPLLCVALASCGGGDDDKKSASTSTKEAAPTKKAPLHNGTFQVNELADCLTTAGVGAAVSLSGATIELNDASSEIIVEQGKGEILVYDSAANAAAQEAGFRKSSVGSSEVTRVRNVLFEADSDLASGDKAKVEGCLGT
jgi:hypothetical protein